jgi:uncharacterized protein
MKISGEDVFFVNYVRDPSKVLLYAPLRSYLAIVSRNTMTGIVSGTDQRALDQIMGKLKPRPLIDILKLHESIKRAIPELSLALTDNCNLKCRYCHHAAGDEGKRQGMTREMLVALYETYLRRLPTPSKARIVFAGGGEPTYQRSLFCFAVNRAKEIADGLALELEFRMATNGCFDDEVRDFIHKQFKEISLSFDGPKHVQDKHRPLKNGEGSFDRVYKTACYFRDTGFPFALRATISSYSIPFLRETINFFAEHFPGKHVGLEPLNPFGRGAYDAEIRPPDKEKFAEALTDAYGYAKGKNIVLVNAAVGKFTHLRTVFCGAVAIPNWTVTTAGRLSCCTRDNAPEVFDYGCFDAKHRVFSLNSEKLERIGKLNVFEYPECQDCFCKYHCAGDCPDLRLSGLLNCDANRKLGEFWLNEHIDRNSRNNEQSNN